MLPRAWALKVGAVVCVVGIGTLGASGRSEPVDVSKSGSVSGPLSGPLSGPVIPPPIAARTLVSKTFEGRVVRPETTPEEAAVKFLVLSEDESAKARAILSERAKILDDFVVGNIDLLTKFGTASATGDKWDQLTLGLEAAAKLRALWTEGSLRTRMRGAIPAARRAEYVTLLREYDDAVASEKARAIPAGEKPKARWEHLAGERLESLGHEIERSFKRQEGSGDLLFAVLTRDLTLSEAKAKRVLDVCRDFAEMTRGREAGEKDKATMFFRVQSELDQSERDQMNKTLFGE